MDLDKSISAVEKYLREFLLFLVAFFWHGRGSEERDPRYEMFNKNIIFALLSAFIGTYLWNRHFGGGSADTIGMLVDNVLRWVSLGVVFYAILWAWRIEAHILVPVIVMVKVFAVAHVVSVFLAYMAKSTVLYLFPGCLYTITINQFGVVVAYGSDLAILLIYLDRESVAILPKDFSHRRRIMVLLPVFIIVTAVVAGPAMRWWHTASHFQDEQNKWRAQYGPIKGDPVRDDDQPFSLCAWVKPAPSQAKIAVPTVGKAGQR